MQRWIALGIAASCLATIAACAGHESIARNDANADLGVLPVGGVPRDLGIFAATDCETQPHGLADCSAQDAEGRRYVFFDGALAKVSVTKTEAPSALRLPANVALGESIESAARKVTSAYGVTLARATSNEGRLVYSSDFVIGSSAGTMYSIELMADQQGRLMEISQRTDF